MIERVKKLGDGERVPGVNDQQLIEAPGIAPYPMLESNCRSMIWERLSMSFTTRKLH